MIGCANPASPDFESTLQSLLAASPKMRGIRWILNWPDFITPTRPDQDYLKVDAFRQGYPLLAKYGLVFDLQLNAPQLAEACVDPRHSLKPNQPVRQLKVGGGCWPGRSSSRLCPRCRCAWSTRGCL